MSHAPLCPTTEDACRRWAGRTAITFEGRHVTYADFWRQVRALAAAYRRLGVRPGDRVICQLPNCPEHLVAVNAAWTCGAVHVGADDDLTGPELAALVERLEPAALVFQPRPGAADPMAPLQHVARRRSSTTLVVHRGPADAVGGHQLDDLLAAEAPGAGAETTGWPAPDDTALLFLTSGTTGRPKAVMETLGACWSKMRFFADALAPGTDDVHLMFLPVAHVFGLRLALLALLRGGRLVMLERFSPDSALRLVDDEAVTVLPGMPTHFRILLDRLDRRQHRLSSLRWAVTAATALPRPLAEDIYERLGVEILYVYGCSEGFTTRTTDRDEILRGSVGRVVHCDPGGTAADGRLAVVDPERHTPLRVGEVGEIAFGASRPVRYWGDPPAATDGWYHTGDLGRIEADGCLFVVGRLRELVNRGGLKVSAAEVEGALVQHPQVADAAVVATPDPVLSEAVCACIVPSGDGRPDLAEVRAFLGRTLARHKLPDELCVVPAIPRTAIGKVDRPALAQVVARGEVARERLRS